MHEQLLLRHLKQLVSFYPKSEDQDSVRAALRYCQQVLRTSGSFKDVLLHKSNGYSSLTASTQGTKAPKLLLQAHVDVVPAGDSPQLVIDAQEGLVYGRGVYDMLFATACYLTFVEEHRSDLASLNIGLMLTGDEELGGCDGVCYLVDEEGYSCEVCVLPDAGEGFGDLSISAKGLYNFDLIVHGQSHHGSRPWEGDGAANKLVLLLHELLDHFDHSQQENSTLTVTKLNCGDANNRGPNKASAHLDIRHKDQADLRRIQSAVDKLCAKYNGEIDNLLLIDDVELGSDYPAVRDFLKLYEKHAGHSIILSKAHGGSDARFFAAHDIPVIMFRPDGAGAHSDHESLSISSLINFYLLLEDYILTTARIS